MYYRDYEEDSASTASGSASSSPPTPPAGHRLFPLPSPRISDPRLWTSSTNHSETTKEVLQSVLKVRKSWKTLRGGETVWPLELEAALLEGLESYVPDDSRETRLLGRFPRRNRFISDYIYEKTGKRRSAKQVGSRLQQLRESCGGKKLLHLLSPFRQPYPDSSASSDSTCTSPVSPQMTPSYTRHTVVYIDILPDGSSEIAPVNPNWQNSTGEFIRVSDRARPLRMINPSVAFVSSTQVNAQSHFTVYAGDRIMHAESVTLVPTRASQVSGVVYSASLVPDYWRTITESPDPTRFTIYQEVRKDDEASTLIFSATYKFAYPDPTTVSPRATGSPQSRPDMDALLSAALDQEQTQPHHSDRYPLYHDMHPQWSRDNSNSPTGLRSAYSNGGSDRDSYACFPPDLTNYVL
ncbi:TEA domain-containing protein [Mycena indigotica]|uniref:TEA domain-containing protein n=1 Tax=Mycena indigotica TaxID=2126181 RepID=A0A8H6RZK5_9AGAR|nr:TEA domain-containing protein [Mycena indigotica]KAF7289747.1 TEA domain-containing protein [Mycena indigotica]